MLKPVLSVIVVSWNTKGLLRDCLRSVYEQAVKYSVEVWVVDNNSPDGSAQMVAAEFPQVNLIPNEDNRGFAAANNQALKLCRGEYILLLNPDTVVLDNATDKMVDFAKSGKVEKLGVLVSKLLNGDGTLQHSVFKFYSFWRSLVENRFFAGLLEKTGSQNKTFGSMWNHDHATSIDWAHGAVMFFSREVYNKVGLLDERFYIYAEEMDYFMRVRKAGYINYFEPLIEITHLGKSSSRQKRAAMFIQNYKSFYIFLLKHYSWFEYLAYRLRASLYLFFWYFRFLAGNGEDAKIQQQVYAETIKWHFSKESFKLL